MRVLVTGASGFLGSWVVRALLQAGDRPLALVRKSSRREGLAGLPIEIAEGDVCDRSSLERAMKQVDAVAHVAGLVSLRRRDHDELTRVNVEGTRNVLEVAAARGLRVLHTSSIATVGFSDTPALLDEWSRPRAGEVIHSSYFASKVAAEDVALSIARDGADVVVLNPGLLLGPGDLHLSSTRFVHGFLTRQAMFYTAGGVSLGDVRRVAAIYPVALRRGVRGERYLLAGVNRSYREIYQELSRVARLPAFPMPTILAQWWALVSDSAALLVPHPFEEVSLGAIAYSTCFNFCDCSKAREVLGYEPGGFESLIAETVADHLARQAATRASHGGGAGAGLGSPQTRARPMGRAD